MERNAGRTSSEDVKLLFELYRVFHPQELRFLIELNQRWSVYDPNRIENMNAILRQTFTSQHKQSDTERVISYLNSPNTNHLFCCANVDAALAEFNQVFHLNPYQSKCPLCLSVLDATASDVISIRLFTLKGKIDRGKNAL